MPSDIDHVKQLVQLLIENKLDILECGEIKIVKSKHETKMPKEEDQNQEDPMTQDELEELMSKLPPGYTNLQ